MIPRLASSRAIVLVKPTPWAEAHGACVALTTRGVDATGGAPAAGRGGPAAPSPGRPDTSLNLAHPGPQPGRRAVLGLGCRGTINSTAGQGLAPDGNAGASEGAPTDRRTVVYGEASLFRDYALTDAELRSGAQGSLRPGQVDEYDEQGYLVLPGLLDSDDLAPVRAAMMMKVDLIADQLMAAGRITDPLAGEPFETRLARLFEGLSAEDFVTFTGRSWRDRLTGYFELMSNPKILDVVESLIGPEIFANPVYNVRPKVPRVAAGEVPWHQDKSYWPGARATP